MVVLDTTVMNIALPSAQNSLAFSNNDRQWVISAYTLAFGSLLLLSGRLADRFGRKTVLILGLVGFALASGVGGASQSFGMLVTARVAQGAFAALLAPAVLALLATTFVNGTERARAFGIFGAISMAGNPLGLLLGGALTQYLSWRWTMYINLIIAIPASIGAIILVSQQKRKSRVTIDLPGATTVTLGLFALVFGFSNIHTDGWTSPVTLVFLGAAVVLIATFVVIQQRSRNPLMPLRVIADRDRGGAMIAMLLSSAGTFTVFLFLTYYLQLTLGYTEIQTGLAFLPVPLVLVVTAAVVGPALGRRVGPKTIIPAGLASGGIGILLLTRLQVDSSYASHLLPSLVLLGIGVGLIISTATSLATLGVTEEDAGVASAVVNAVQQIGGSLGVAVLNTLAAAGTAYLIGRTPSAAISAEAAVHSYATAFWWASWIFLLGALITALVLRRSVPTALKDAEPSPGVEPIRTNWRSAGMRWRLGAGIWVLGTLQFFAMHLVVQAAWPQPYSWWRNYISDLGAVRCGTFLGNDVCSPLHAWMNLSFVLQGLFLVIGVICTGPVWRGAPTGRVWRALVLLAGAGWIVVGFVPEDQNLMVHSIGALPIFVLGNVALVLAGRSIATRELRFVRRVSLVLGVIGLLGIGLTAVAIARPDGVVGVGAAERLTVFPLQVWAFLVGLHLLWSARSTVTRDRSSQRVADRPQNSSALS
jgi:EmrB/QacA subfamily drug resistance transporter